MSTSAEFVNDQYESGVPIAQRVREMLRRCRLLEGPDVGKRFTKALAVKHYAEDVRYALGMVTVLVDERADRATRAAELSVSHALEVQKLRSDLEDARRDTASAVDEAAEYLRELRRVEDDVVQLTADLERARRG